MGKQNFRNRLIDEKILDPLLIACSIKLNGWEAPLYTPFASIPNSISIFLSRSNKTRPPESAFAALRRCFENNLHGLA